MVGGHCPKRFGGELLAELGRDSAEFPQVLDDGRIVEWIGDGRHTRGIAGGGTQQRCTTHVDHLDGLVEAHHPRTDRWRERLDVDHDDVDQADALRG